MGACLHTHYDTLGVGREASPEQVRSAYRRRAQACHPDKLPLAAQSEPLMAQINRAYAVLSDPPGRAAYDRWIEAHEELVESERILADITRTDGWSAWPWYLLGATIAFAMFAVGTVLYTEMVPSVAAPLIAAPQGTPSSLPAAGTDAGAAPALPGTSPRPNAGRPDGGRQEP